MVQFLFQSCYTPTWERPPHQNKKQKTKSEVWIKWITASSRLRLYCISHESIPFGVCLPFQTTWQMKVLPGRVILWEPIAGCCLSAAVSQLTVLCWPSAFRKWWLCGAQLPGSSWRLCPSRQELSGQSVHMHIQYITTFIWLVVWY